MVVLLNCRLTTQHDIDLETASRQVALDERQQQRPWQPAIGNTTVKEGGSRTEGIGWCRRQNRSDETPGQQLLLIVAFNGTTAALTPTIKDSGVCMAKQRRQSAGLVGSEQ